MRTRVYKLYGSVSATTNAAAQITVQRPGIISAILFSGRVDGLTNDTAVYWELAFGSTSQIAVNDTQGSLAECSYYINTLTSGIIDGAIQSLVNGIAIPVAAGDRLYLNAVVVGSLDSRLSAFLYVAE